MHHIWFLTIGPRIAAHADIPRHQPHDYPRYIRWLIWLMGFFAGGWVNRNRDYLKLFKALSTWRYRLLLPDDSVYLGPPNRCRRYWDPRKHFDWVLDAYAHNPNQTDEIPF